MTSEIYQINCSNVEASSIYAAPTLEHRQGLAPLCQADRALGDSLFGALDYDAKS